MFDVTQAAVEGALAAGAAYADARVVVTRTQLITARDEAVETLSQSESIGVGARALMGSSWGFFATPQTTDTAARQAGERAAASVVSGVAKNPHDEPISALAPTPIDSPWLRVSTASSRAVISSVRVTTTRASA